MKAAHDEYARMSEHYIDDEVSVCDQREIQTGYCQTKGTLSVS
jgi:hypothetical protein